MSYLEGNEVFTKRHLDFVWLSVTTAKEIDKVKKGVDVSIMNMITHLLLAYMLIYSNHKKG